MNRPASPCLPLGSRASSVVDRVRLTSSRCSQVSSRVCLDPCSAVRTRVHLLPPPVRRTHSLALDSRVLGSSEPHDRIRAQSPRKLAPTMLHHRLRTHCISFANHAESAPSASSFSSVPAFLMMWMVSSLSFLLSQSSLLPVPYVRFASYSLARFRFRS